MSKRNLQADAQIAEVLHELAQTERVFRQVQAKVKQVDAALSKPIVNPTKV